MSFQEQIDDAMSEVEKFRQRLQAQCFIDMAQHTPKQKRFKPADIRFPKWQVQFLFVCHITTSGVTGFTDDFMKSLFLWRRFRRAIKRPLWGWEYRVVADLDLVNIDVFPKSVGVQTINNLAILGWKPVLMLSNDLKGYKVTMLFKRWRTFPKIVGWKERVEQWDDNVYD